MNTSFIDQKLLANVRSWGTRRKTAKQHEGCVRTLGNATRWAVNVKLGTPAQTASWRFDTGGHRIELGGQWRAGLLPTAAVSDSKSYSALQSLLLHECWHGHLTQPALNDIAAKCRTKGIPFALLNLFEDARIEHAARQHPSTRGQRFGWVNFYAQPEETQRPTEYFWALINGESSAFSSLTVRAPRWTGGDWKPLNGAPTIPAGAVGRTIREFFARAISAASTEAIVDLCESWLRTFGRATPPQPRVTDSIGAQNDGSSGGTPVGPEVAPVKNSGGASGGNGSVTNGGLYDEAAPAQTEADANAYGGPTSAPVHRHHRGIEFFQDGGLTRKYSGSTRGQDLVNALRPLVAQQVATLTGLVRRADTAPIRTGCDGPRIHPQNAVSGQANAFLQRGAAKGKRKIVVVFDGSGSMAGRHNTHGRPFLLSLAALHRSGTLHVDVYLTGDGYHHKVDLRQPDAELASIAPAHGCESYAATLAAIPLQTLRDASAVVCYTDGNISDGLVDAGAYRGKGVNLIGAATCSSTSQIPDALQLHFGRHVTRESGAQLAGALCEYITRSTR